MAPSPDAPISEASVSDSPPVETVDSKVPTRTEVLRRWKTRLVSGRWRTGLLLTASLLGCQALAASGQITAPAALVIPGGLDGARFSFLQGMQLGEEAVRSCGAKPAAIVTHELGRDDDPAGLFPKDGQGQLLLPPLLVVPYGADVRLFSRLTHNTDTRVLLAHQRGSSLDTLSGLDAQGRIWPLVPGRLDDLRALAKDAIARGWKRVVVVSDPSTLEGDRAASFVELFEGSGGKVLSYTQDKVQELDGQDRDRLALLEKDLDWLGPDAVVLSAPPRGTLAQWLRQRQGEQGAIQGPAWIWLSGSAQAAEVKPQPWPQLVLQAPAHGPGWTSFAKAFGQRWGYAPNLIAAAGYETARVLALTTAGPVPLASDGTRDPLAWLDPSADPLPLCKALAQRRQGASTRVEGVASDFALRSGKAPSGVAESRLIAAQ